MAMVSRECIVLFPQAAGVLVWILDRQCKQLTADLGSDRIISAARTRQPFLVSASTKINDDCGLQLIVSGASVARIHAHVGGVRLLNPDIAQANCHRALTCLRLT
jgi:hypothetical protein